MAKDGEKIIQSVGRAIDILRCFENNEELGVTEISKMIELHKSTAFGLISTLEAYRLLEKNDETGRYRLGIELFRLGTKVNANLRKIVVPYLERLVKTYQETVNLVMLEDLHVVYLEKIEGTHSMRISTLVGGRLPLYCTAVGKALLAFMTESDMLDKLERTVFKQYTEKTICDRESLVSSLETIKKNRYAEEFEELEYGLCCVASPIFNHLGNAFAAISVSGPSSRMNPEFRKEIGETLINITNEISAKLGY